jgi:hypothetical protein
MIKRADWKTVISHNDFKVLPIVKILNDADAENLLKGFKPRDIEDRWFVYFEAGWGFIHRSLTGYLIYKIKLDGCPMGARISEAYVSNSKGEYKSNSESEDIKTLNSIINFVCEVNS